MEKNLVLGVMATLAEITHEDKILYDLKEDINSYLIKKDEKSRSGIEFNIILWSLKIQKSPMKSVDSFIKDMKIVEKEKEREAQKN